MHFLQTTAVVTGMTLTGLSDGDSDHDFAVIMLSIIRSLMMCVFVRPQEKRIKC